jgi:hypothetical protein
MFRNQDYVPMSATDLAWMSEPVDSEVLAKHAPSAILPGDWPDYPHYRALTAQEHARHEMRCMGQ